jgi:hypothetical protein
MVSWLCIEELTVLNRVLSVNDIAQQVSGLWNKSRGSKLWLNINFFIWNASAPSISSDD